MKHDVAVKTWPRNWQLLCAANLTTTSVAALTPTATEPTGDGVIDLSPDGTQWNNVLLAFFGVGVADQVGKARVTAWRRVTSGGTTLWVPETLTLLTFTLGTQTGVAATPIVAANLFADTIAETTAFTTAEEIRQGATPDQSLATIAIDIKGAEKIQVTFDKNTVGTSVNGLYSGY